MFVSLLLSILWNVGEQRTREDKRQVLSSGEVAEFYSDRLLPTDLSLKLHKSSLGRLAWVETKQVLPTSPMFWWQVAKPPVGWDSHRALTTLLRGSTADRACLRNNPESWGTMRGQQPGQIHSKTSVTLSRPTAVWGQSSEKCTGSFPLTRTPSGQGAELAVRRRQLPAGPFHPWSNFSPAAALSGRSETYHRIWQRSAALWSSARSGSGRSCKLQVSDSWKIVSLFTIFCCFSWQWKKLSL